MPLYDFKSDSGKITELFFKMGECPENILIDGETYVRIFSVPNVAMDSTKPKTIQDLGIQNYERAVKNGKIKPKKEKKKPWWRDSSKVDTSLANMSAAQTERYIMEGKK